MQKRKARTVKEILLWKWHEDCQIKIAYYTTLLRQVFPGLTLILDLFWTPLDKRDISSSLWSSPPGVVGKDSHSHSENPGSHGGGFTRDCSACAILAAADGIIKTHRMTE